MSSLLIFSVSVVLSFGAWGAVCYRYLWPRIRDLSLYEVAQPILFLHLFRFVGLAFLIPGVLGWSVLPESFAVPAAYGDLVAVGLAWLALLLGHRLGATAALWVFNVWEVLTYYLPSTKVFSAWESSRRLSGAAYFIPTVLVPLLLSTHAMLFVLLLRAPRQ